MKVEVRERRARAAKAAARKAFAKSMEEAEDYARELLAGEGRADAGELGGKFVEWGQALYKWLKDDTPMSKAHMQMRDTSREIQRTAAACAKATEARVGPKRRERQRNAAAALIARRVAVKADKAFAQKMEAALEVAMAAKAEKYSAAAVAAGETAYQSNWEAWRALEVRVGLEFREYSVNKYHSLMWPGTPGNTLSAASKEMEARWRSGEE